MSRKNWLRSLAFCVLILPLAAGAQSLSLPTAATVQAPENAPLHVRVFNGGDANMGFGVNSAIVYGKHDAVLIDSQFTLSNAHRLVAEILETGRDLKFIYISHMHPDHFMGLSAVHEAFPKAQVVALPEVAAMVNKAYPFKIGYWTQQILHQNGSATAVNVQGLTEPFIELEGQRLEVLGPTRGDSDLATGVWIPSIKTLVAADIVFSHAHVWIADAKTPPMRKAWLDELDKLQALGPEVVVPGHAISAADVSPDAIAFTREYIKAFQDAMYKAHDSQEIIDAMNRQYPGLATQICLEYSARIMKDHYKWPGEWPPELRQIQAY
ncbi:MBL fold metallo-hydrolase [Achromobacter sp. AONIH1]|uniref:MBL fold metallo-hydrolase n=1 Tax=Achromobacter sp. AONIH1 TaxID=1758194 RepID=UPI000CD0DA94|nr:MBL fold metallo-hydrolase [Achromobacter sp. AONIH1]AUT46389.1 MBL fold hydrolase [Achromobacter sp. AONIH1]